MSIRRNCWRVAAAAPFTVILGAIAFCLAFGGWGRVRELWLTHLLKSRGVEVYVIGDSWDEGPWSLFPPRRYQLIFKDVRPDFQLALRLREVTDLSFHNVQLTLGDCRDLGNLHTVDSLDLERVTVPFDGWEALGNLRGLICLGITDVKLGEPGAAWVARLPSLAYLSAWDATFPSSQPPAGDLFPRLKEASFLNCEMGENFLAALSHAPLEHLELLDCRFPAGALNRLAGLRKLRSLTLVADISGERVSSLLQSLRGLSEVSVSVDSDGDTICRSLEGLPHLMEVEITVKRKNKVGDRGLKHLGRAQRLTKLAVNAQEVTNAGAEYLAGCRNLRSLTLTNSRITDDGLAAFAQLPELYELHISGSRISDDGLQKLMRNKAIRLLDASRTDVTDRGLAYVRDWRELQVLDIRGTRVSRAGIAQLKRQRPDLVVVTDDD